MTAVITKENSLGTIRLDKQSEAPIAINCDEIDGNLSIRVKSGINAEVNAELNKAEKLDINIILEDSSGLHFRFTADPLSSAKINQKVKLGKGSALQCKIITRGNCDHELTSEVYGERSVSNIDWIFHAVEENRQRVSVKNIFSVSKGSGEVFIKGVADGNAYVNCEGVVEVGAEGRMSKVDLKEEVLMLGERAKVDLIPAMEIKNDDVKASHSASVKRINPEDLFYFSSRGIGEREARGVIVEGFLGE